tara:strand:- start:132 stop:308 length:177 start_codon:yes stop_codon:yes gene_type:complete
LQILTHSHQFFDILLLKDKEMIKKLLNTLIRPKVTDIIDGKTWIQKILLEEKFGKINS